MNTPEAQDLKIYELTNKTTGQRHFSVSTNAHDACKQAGWLIGDCFIVEQKPRRKPVPGLETTLLYKVPCQTCPFLYSECRKPDTEKCPTQPSAPDLNEWLKQVSQAHLCPFVGQDLKTKDYRLGQKWVQLEDAISTLSSKPPPPTQNPLQPSCQPHQ